MKKRFVADGRSLLSNPVAGLLIGALWLGGCAELQESPLGPRHHPSNVSSAGNSVAEHLRRVAVLPLAAVNSGFDAQAGVETLEPVLMTELQKQNRFEALSVSRADLLQWTGRPAFRGDEVLPEHALERIQKETGCDGVLFATLTVYRPYAPPAIGWRMRLVTVPDKTTVWSADEVFDATDLGVANSALDYQSKQPMVGAGLREGRKILISPSAFGHYTANALLETLPPNSH